MFGRIRCENDYNGALCGANDVLRGDSMPRYVIEMDEPRSCRDCPCIWEDITEGLEPSKCQLADNEWLPPGYDDNKPPEWCPLQLLDDASLE